jgi:hypothetical protein
LFSDKKIQDIARQVQEVLNEKPDDRSTEIRNPAGTVPGANQGAGEDVTGGTGGVHEAAAGVHAGEGEPIQGKLFSRKEVDQGLLSPEGGWNELTDNGGWISEKGTFHPKFGDESHEEMSLPGSRENAVVVSPGSFGEMNFRVNSLNGKTVPLLQDAFSRLLSDDRVFLDYGKKSVEFNTPEAAREWLDAKEISGQMSSEISKGAKTTSAALVLDQLAKKYEVGNVNTSIKYEPSFILPNGQVIYLGTVWHPAAITSVPEGTKFGGTETARTQFINESGAIQVRPNMTPREGETFHVGVPKTGITHEQVDALQNMMTELGGYGNLAVETADTPELSRSNMQKPEDWQFKSANDVRPILAKLGVLPGQKVDLSPAYGETGKYLGGHERYDLGKMEAKQPELPARYKGVVTPEQVIHHEVGHGVVGEKVGFPLAKMISGQHPSALRSGAAAQTFLDLSSIPGAIQVEDGSWKFPEDSINEDIVDRFGTALLGGAAADELLHGVKIRENIVLAGDLRTFHQITDALGCTARQKEILKLSLFEKAKRLLTENDGLAKIQKHTAERPEGLDKTLLMDDAGWQRLMQDIRGESHERETEGLEPTAGTGKPGTSGAGVGGGTEPEVAGGKEEVTRGATGESRTAQIEAPRGQPVDRNTGAGNAAGTVPGANQGPGEDVTGGAGVSMKRQLSELPAPIQAAWRDYVDDVDFAFRDPDKAYQANPKFELRNIPLKNLEKAKVRPLRLTDIDTSMAGQSRTSGPVVLDADFSVIDGMHRLADAWKKGARTVQAWVRIGNDTNTAPSEEFSSKLKSLASPGPKAKT